MHKLDEVRSDLKTLVAMYGGKNLVDAGAEMDKVKALIELYLLDTTIRKRSGKKDKEMPNE